MPAPPKTQGLSSATFTQPPLDESLSLPEIYDWQLTNSQKHPLFVYEDGPGSTRTICWDEGVQAMHRATQYIRDVTGIGVNQDKAASLPIIAVLAASDTITFFTFIVGALRTGYTLFPISTRNSPQAVAALLSQTNVTHLFVSGEASLQALGESSINLLPGSLEVKRHRMPIFEDLFPTTGFDPEFHSVPLGKISMDEPAMILHSSGTTAFPKPIYKTHRSLVWFSALPCFGEIDFADDRTGCHCIPMFHGMGLVLVAFAPSCGIAIAAFKPQSPAVVPNPMNVLEGAVATQSDFIFCPPTFLEVWARDTHSISSLAGMKGVIYGGGPLDKEAGDYLTTKGVNIYVTYAATQVAIVSVFLPKPPLLDWEYFQLSSNRQAHFIDNGNNEYEIVILSSKSFQPNVINTRVGDYDAFATSDLVTPHPTKPGFWKVTGRTDDQIMHSTGEKTNPGPLETILCKDPHIQAAIMFGRSRFHCGVLVQPKAQHAFDPKDIEKLIQFRNFIWPTVEKVNAFAPTHSRLFKEMIIVTSPSKPFSYTPKGTPRRQATLDEYAEEIEAVYSSVDESAQEDIPPPSDWSYGSIKSFVRMVVDLTMKSSTPVADDADLFDNGCDSLQATWIRNTILNAVRKKHPHISRRLSVTFVFEHPTVLSLSRFLHSSIHNEGLSDEENAATRKAELWALVDKYSGKGNTGRTILVTGGTGTLGSNLVAKAISSNAITKVYALSRATRGGAPVHKRYEDAFSREGLDLLLLKSDKVCLLEGDVNAPHFGVSQNVFNEMVSSVIHIVHCAWRIDFNLSIASFEENIRATRSIVEFALSTRGLRPAKVIFISSIGVFAHAEASRPALEKLISDPEWAIGQGYGEAKWVSEQILARAAKTSALKFTVIRPGQLVGGPSYYWKEDDWFPSLVKSSIAVGSLPDAPGTISWLRSDVASSAILEMMDSDEEFLHLEHPQPIAWSKLMAYFSTCTGLPVVPYNEWLDALEKSQRDLESSNAQNGSLEDVLRINPALRLLRFFRNASARLGPDTEALGLPKLSLAKASVVSPTLRGISPWIDEDVVRTWLSHWKVNHKG